MRELGMVAGEMDRFDSGLLARVAGAGGLAAFVLTLGAALVDLRAALGAALGSAIGLSLFALHRRLFGGLPAFGASAVPHRRARLAGLAGAWALWAFKLPVLLGALYLALASGWVAPGWLCAGVSVVPAAAVALALDAVATDLWRAAGVRR